MKHIYLLLICATLMSFSSCNTIRGLFEKPAGGVGFIPYNPLTFQQDSTEAAKFDVQLSKINDEYVIAHSKKGGSVTIKNSFNSKQKNVGNTTTGKKAGQQKDAGNTAVKDKSVVKEKPKIKAKDAGVIGNENKVSRDKGIPPLLIYIALGLVMLFFVWPRVRKFF